MELAMIEISETVALPSGKKKLGVCRSVSDIIKRFQGAYKQVYGRIPLVEYQQPWIKIDSQKTRVNVSRLKEMSRQLESRLL